MVEYAPATGETRVRFPDGVAHATTETSTFCQILCVLTKSCHFARMSLFFLVRELVLCSIVAQSQCGSLKRQMSTRPSICGMMMLANSIVSCTSSMIIWVAWDGLCKVFFLPASPGSTHIYRGRNQSALIYLDVLGRFRM